MKDFLSTIINKIPPLPESVMKIESYAKDPNVSYKQVSQMLQKDPVLTSEILKAANFPLYGFSRQITTLESAISLFGLGTIRGFVLAVYVRKNFDFTLEPYGITSQQFSLCASRHHVFATNWYFKSKPRLFDVLSPATFLSNLGQVLISQYIINEKKSSDFNRMLQEQPDSKEVEKTFCGITAVELTAEIFEHWSMETSLINALRYMHSPQNAPKRDARYAQILQCIHTAIGYDGMINDESVEKATELVKTYGLDLEGFLQAVQAV